MKFNAFGVGLYTGLLFAVWHAIWSLLVLLGIAMPLMNFVFYLHFLNNPFSVKPFSLVTAIELVVLVFAVWFIIGYLGTICWNKMQKGK